MSGFNTIKVIREFEQAVDDLGLEICEPNKWYKDNVSNDAIRLSPRDDQLPHYSRDASIFEGSIEECIHWIRGIQWARGYDVMTKVSTPKKRGEQEQKERNRQLMQSIKSGRKVEGEMNSLYGITTEQMYNSDDQEVPF